VRLIVPPSPDSAGPPSPRPRSARRGRGRSLLPPCFAAQPVEDSIGDLVKPPGPRFEERQQGSDALDAVSQIIRLVPALAGLNVEIAGLIGFGFGFEARLSVSDHPAVAARILLLDRL